jgi:hypothetical protein
LANGNENKEKDIIKRLMLQLQVVNSTKEIASNNHFSAVTIFLGKICRIIYSLF